MNAHTALRTYVSRTAPCPDCQDGKQEYYGANGLISSRCQTCGGTGEIDAVCCECGKDRTLNSEGLCERCTDSAELPVALFNAKYGLKVAPFSELQRGSGEWL